MKTKKDIIQKRKDEEHAENVIEFIRERFANTNYLQIFFTPAIRDERVLIYMKNEIRIFYSREWGYIDILGLNQEEEKVVKTAFNLTKYGRAEL